MIFREPALDNNLGKYLLKRRKKDLGNIEEEWCIMARMVENVSQRTHVFPESWRMNKGLSRDEGVEIESWWWSGQILDRGNGGLKGPSGKAKQSGGVGDQGRAESWLWLMLRQGAWGEEVAQRAMHTCGSRGKSAGREYNSGASTRYDHIKGSWQQHWRSCWGWRHLM